MKLLDERMEIKLKPREQPSIATGIPQLDTLLLGGIHRDALLHFYGNPGTGKTTVAMQIMANIVRQGFRGLWVDCNGAFSLDRFTQVLGDPSLLPDFLYVRPNSFSHQTQVLQQTQYLLERVGIIVVDPITHFYRAERYAEGSHGYFQELISTQLGALVGYATLRKIPVIVVNYSTRNSEGESVPLVARGFQRYERYRFAFSDLPSEDPEATVTQHQITIELAPEKYAQHRTLTFTITRTGIQSLEGSI